MDELRFEALSHDDIGPALRLSIQAGWNQTAGDWKRLIDLSPRGCFAGRIEGRLVATSTVVSYGRQAHWIGMVIVDEAYRGHGFGRSVLERAIRHAADLGTEAIGLDATDLGRPVYLKNNLVDVAPIERWSGALRETPGIGRVETLDRCDLDEVIVLDREACGVDRGPLMFHLATEADVSGWVVREEGRLAGYAFLRPGREQWHLGPMVAEETGAYASLLSAAARRIPGRSVLVDVLKDPGTTEALAGSGLSVQRRLTRMTYRRPQPLLMGERVGAATAFEWG